MSQSNNFSNIVNFFFVGFAATLWLCSCSLHDSRNSDNLAALQALKQRGLLLVSETDDFLAQNVLVADMAGNSKEVAKLISARGYPKAVEVLEAAPDGNKVNFYFVEPIEAFEILFTGPSTSIFGPLQLSQNDKASVAEKLSLYNPEQAAQPPLDKKLLSADGADSKASQIAGLIRAENAANMTKQPRDERGNLIHEVKFPTESIQVLALWYTMEQANTARIARINKRGELSSLKPGDKIMIPGYMLKNTIALTEQALNSLLNLNPKLPSD